MASETDFQPQLRLHRLSWLFALTSFLKQMIVPLVALLLFGARNQFVYWVPLFVVPMLVGALWQQWIYRYGFGPRGLVIHEGMFFRNVRQIDYGRIENIDTERGLLHRLLGVAQVRVQTSTGGKPEALIRVLSMEAVQEMRAHVFAESPSTRREEAPAQVEEPPLLALPPGELVRYGLIDNRGMIIVAAAAGLLYEFGLFEVLRRQLAAWLETTALAELVALGPTMQIALAATGILGALGAVRVLSIAVALVTLHDFALTRRDGDLRVHHGLLTRIALTMRTPRIQAVHQTESLLHRWFGRMSLRVDLTGDTSVENQQGGARAAVRWLAPLCRPEQAPALIAAALPGIDLETAVDWQPLAPRARTRHFKRTSFLWLLLAAGPTIWYLREWAAIVLLAGIPLAWLHAHLYVKHTRWALTPEVVMFRRGWLTRRLTIVPRNRVQSVQLTNSPFDRRHDMASVSVDTAGGSVREAGIYVRYLGEDVARRLSLALYRTAVAPQKELPDAGRGSIPALWSSP